MNIPLVSVVMPVYGVERYVADAVRSILSQTLRAFELIVVDDCSPDASIAIVQSFDDPRIRLVRHEVNQGLAAARNTGIAHARGRFVALLDSDDMSVPERLSLQVDALDRRPALVGCGGAMRCMDASGRSHGIVHTAETDSQRIPATLLFRNTFFVSSMMFRRSALASLRYRSDFRMAEDYEFMVRASGLGPLANLPDLLLHYRVHPASMTSTKPQLMDECRRRIALQQLKALGIEATAAEMDCHMHAAIPGTQATKPQLEALESWLMLLAQRNRSRKVYPEAALDDVLAATWFEACTLASGLGPWALSRYLRSPLRGTPGVAPRRMLKFAAKSVLRLQRGAFGGPRTA